MGLPLAYYGNPVLREKGARVEGVTEELASFVDDMFETMEEYRGIGLAAPAGVSPCASPLLPPCGW